MGSLDRGRQDFTCLITCRAGREDQAERHLDILQVMTVPVADAVGIDGDLERFGHGTFPGDHIDVDTATAADRSEEEFDRGEQVIPAASEAQFATATVGGNVMARGGAIHSYRAV